MMPTSTSYTSATTATSPPDTNKPLTRRNKINKRVLSRRPEAALVIAALTCTSCVDTIHAFSESFPSLFQSRIPQHHRFMSPHPSTIHTSPLSPKHIHTYDSPFRGTTNPSPTALFYAPNHHTTQTAPMVAQAFYASHKRNRNPTKPKTRNSQTSTMPLSNSVLNPSDTLPEFPTAHGLLSPETVMRMEVMTSRGRDRAVDFFLETYRKEGPMACLPMLSDEDVLPRLTEAMRDIIA